MHIHTDKYTQAHAKRHTLTHTGTISTALFQSAFTHAHSYSLKLGHFLLLVSERSVSLHFKVNVQKCGLRQSWTTVTREAKLEAQLNPHVAFAVPPTPFTHTTIKALTRIRPPELGPVTIATC